MKRTPFLTTAALVASLFAADNMASTQETVEAVPPLTMNEDGSYSVDETQAPNFVVAWSFGEKGGTTAGKTLSID